MSEDAARDDGCESDATDPEMPELVPAPLYSEQPVPSQPRKSAPLGRSILETLRNEGLSEEQSMALAMAMSGARLLPASVRTGGAVGGSGSPTPGSKSADSA
uniref:Uncharacterized protein n=1 Tax=Alexandrium catenella TaxID=2925 RepID=A0A7S1R7N1_ALECA